MPPLSHSPVACKDGLLVIGEGKTRRDDVTRTFQLLHDLPSRKPVRTPY